MPGGWEAQFFELLRQAVTPLEVLQETRLDAMRCGANGQKRKKSAGALGQASAKAPAAQKGGVCGPLLVHVQAGIPGTPLLGWR